ncbi:theronine dehydrogenase-like Zn-dependent dehydrogenase [Chthonomonas calidirosea]|uniref:Threonine dehydrogenase and related Zn-dependent dehydrogenases n=1 Tax=Chthonomonas calidirosea (strain DSM 23976 / ICMP 18418 / T49) TaxID=1303518 RepID=S0EXX6_CHTCT|nr:zinc-dependent alcohol dehydrogenase family protein [Chthonomonas calidirosea]CCW36554.1 Threonine dehydrogenase and related Zn-dependent dehydrogenases [Chthonomonas calidirosea T49]CEK16988.1 theronine dehydrogenase-like Zn-dependent dehydrogenase [Chthonomonas calidirosea]
MRATVLSAPREVHIDQVPDARIIEPTDAVIRVVVACICGSDLWPYRGFDPLPETGRRMGHEAIGVVEEVGSEVRTVRKGDLVLMPFAFSDGTCVFCSEGLHTACTHGGFFSYHTEGAQAEAVRIPFADGTLYKVTAREDDKALLPHLLTLTDVMGTGHHAAVTARVRQGTTAAIIGDGAVGLCGVIAAKRLGAERIILLGRHPDRIALAREFGATDIVTERGDAAIEAVRERTGGLGAHSVLECVGTEEAMRTAVGIVRPGGAIGRVGVPHHEGIPAGPTFYNNITISGGPAPTRAYMDELLPDVLEGRILPGRVFDRTLPLEQVAEGYRAMDERQALKVMLVP